MVFSRILFVDDDEISTFLSKQLLLQVDPDLSIKIMTKGEDAIQMLRDGNKIDLIFLDLNMPGMDGIEFIEEFNKFKLEAKIVILTSIELPKDKMFQLEQLNCCDILLKPITRNKIETIMSLQ